MTERVGKAWAFNLIRKSFFIMAMSLDLALPRVHDVKIVTASVVVRIGRLKVRTFFRGQRMNLPSSPDVGEWQIVLSFCRIIVTSTLSLADRAWRKRTFSGTTHA